MKTKRMITGKSDGLLGITIDKYDNFILCQVLSAGTDCHIYECSDVDVRKKEGLGAVTSWLTEPQESTECLIEEHGIKISVDVVTEHKTRFYLDQIDSRLAA